MNHCLPASPRFQRLAALMPAWLSPMQPGKPDAPWLLYLGLEAEVIEISIAKPLEIPGTVDVRIQHVRNGLPEPSEVVDTLSESDLLQLLEDHRAAGYSECNRFGRPLQASTVHQVPPPLHLPAKDVTPGAPDQAASPAPLPAESDRIQPQEITLPMTVTVPNLEEFLQKLKELNQGWASLSREEQLARRNAIYQLRTQAKKAAKDACVDLPALPPIPKVTAAADDEAQAEEEVGPEPEEEVITLASVLEALASLKREVWLVMADVQALPAEEQRQVGLGLDALAKAARCGANCLGESSIYSDREVGIRPTVTGRSSL